jgi:hypothetical protein
VDRGQSTLFPALLDDYVAEDNPVRAVYASGEDPGFWDDRLGFLQRWAVYAAALCSGARFQFQGNSSSTRLAE